MPVLPLAYATPVSALVGVCGGIAYILREARQMQNNLADSQHLGGVSMAVAPAFPNSGKRFNACWCAVAGLANQLLYYIQ